MTSSPNLSPDVAQISGDSSFYTKSEGDVATGRVADDFRNVGNGNCGRFQNGVDLSNGYRNGAISGGGGGSSISKEIAKEIANSVLRDFKARLKGQSNNINNSRRNANELQSVSQR